MVKNGGGIIYVDNVTMENKEYGNDHNILHFKQLIVTIA